MPLNKRLLALVVVLFTVIVFAVLFMAGKKIISFPMAMLMLIALLGLYMGFGFLIAVYRFVQTLK